MTKYTTSRTLQIRHLACCLLLLAMMGLAAPSHADYWEGAISPPVFDIRYPKDAEKPSWNRSQLNILCIVQIMDGLGRRQAEEFQAFTRKLNGEHPFALCALDREENEWPVEYIRETWDRQKFTIPLFDLSPELRKPLFAGFEQRKISAFPQTHFISPEGKLLRTLIGFQAADQLETALQAVLSPTENAHLQDNVETGSAFPGLVNGSMSAWAVEAPAPTGWEARETNPAKMLRFQKSGEGQNLSVELRALPKDARRQILFQRLASSPALLGKKIRLSGMAKSNCIGKPVIALGMPTNEAGVYQFAPESPFITRDGKDIPMRLLTLCEFDQHTSEWQYLERETRIPERGKLFVIMAYLDNPEASSAAALFDNIKLEIIP